MLTPASAALSTTQLAYVVAIDRHRTWADAARSLGVTPSALSQGIAELERRLDVPLYATEGRRRVALDHTADVVAYAERIVAEVDEMCQWLRQIAGGRIGRLRVGMIDIFAVHYGRQTVSQFRAEHPQLDISFAVAPTGTLLQQLERAELDVAICVDPEGGGNFDAEPLVRDELAVYAPPGTRRRLPPRQWGPWLLFPPGSRTRAAINRRLADVGAPLVVAMESHQPEVLREMAGLGFGWTVLPTAQAESGPHDLVRIGTEALLTRTISAVTRRGGGVHPAIRPLITALVTALVTAPPPP